jgi:hypothetical protein
MAKRDRLVLSQHQSVETYRDHCGRAFVAYSGGASVFIRDVAELRRFLKIPKSIPMRESLESWLASLADMDAQRKSAKAPEGLSAEHLATGFGPEAHADEGEDPTANTKLTSSPP